VSALHVLLKVAGAEYVVAAADVLQMESYSGATRVPGTSGHVAGLIQVRGRVLPVIDLRARFGLERHDPTADARVIVVQQGSRAVALLADSAREVVRIDPAQFHTAPQMMTDAGQGFVKSLARVGERLVMLLDLPRVLGEERTDAQ
jgi:purine-binding chemotaxis protein CheW